MGLRTQVIDSRAGNLFVMIIVFARNERVLATKMAKSINVDFEIVEALQDDNKK